jgi:predicted DCC family thiol-disulfide oxidoreductase YuxK
MVSAESQPATEALPTPDERPGADVVVYDGQCGMCRSQIRRLARWDRGGRLAFLSLHDPEVARRYPDLRHDDLMREMVVVDRADRRHWGASAVRYLSRRLPRLWWLAPLLHIPGSLPLWRWLYRWVARHRYWFGGQVACDDGSCSLHR